MTTTEPKSFRGAWANLTLSSTRTPPTLLPVLSHLPAFSAPLVASVQAGPVSFIVRPHHIGFDMEDYRDYTKGLIDHTTKHFQQMAVAQEHRDNPVYKVMDAVKDYVEEFERTLDEEHEVGVRLVSYGGVIMFHAEYIGFTPPNVITFGGTTPEGERVQLIQHVSQLSFLLKAVPKLDEKPRRVGFNAHEA